MIMIESRWLRIIPGGLPATSFAADARAHGFDYAALVRRARARRVLPGARGDQMGSGTGKGRKSPGAGASRECGESQASERHLARSPIAHAWVTLGENETLANVVSDCAGSIVNSVSRRQENFLRLATFVMSEIAAFCSEPAIAGDNWDVQMSLDPALLPDTILRMSLSPFMLRLDFDTSSSDARLLLLEHSNQLQREIALLLAAWGSPRDVELRFW